MLALPRVFWSALLWCRCLRFYLAPRLPAATHIECTAMVGREHIEAAGQVQTHVVIKASTRACRVCAHADPLPWGLHTLTMRGSGTGRGWPGPLAFLSSICSPRNPDTLGNGIREKAEMALTLPAEPEFLESEAGEKRPFR